MALSFKTFIFRREFRRSIRNCGSHIVSAVVVVFFLGVWTSCRSASAQLFAPPAAADEEAEKSSGLPSERRVNQQLEELTEAGKKKKISDIRETLDLLRGADPMLMVPDPRGVFIPLHRDLVQRLQAIDGTLLESLDAKSEQPNFQIDRGIAQGPEALLRATHEAAGTRSGWLGHLMLATIHHDRGNSLAAQYWLRPLLTPAIPEDIRLVAEKLSDQILAAATVSNSKTPSASAPNTATRKRDEPRDERKPTKDLATEESKKLPAVSEESVAKEQPSDLKSTDAAGGASDDFKAAPNEGPSLFVHWMQRLSLSEAERRVSQDLVRRAHDRSLIPWSAWEPLADDQFVFVRTPYLIKAFQRQTGTHLWTKVIQRRPAQTEDFPPGFPMPSGAEGRTESNLLQSAEVRTVHRNEIVGRMSADSERLFAVCQIVDGFSLGSENMIRMRVMMDQNMSASAGLWELIALEKSTGRRLWTVGGVPIEDRFGNDFSGCWFAGPPTVYGDELLTVIERKQAMELASLDASTGQLRWSVPLAFPNDEIHNDPARQGLAAHVTVEGGVIFTTTTTGWLFAVDSLSHTVLWARKLPVTMNTESRPNRFQMRAMGRALPSELPAFAEVWRSEPPLVAGKAIVLSSSECSQLMVVESLTGRVLHRSSAGQSKVILYGDESTLILASGKAIQAMSLPDLKKLWSHSIEKLQTVPVGRAACYQDQLLIPMSDGEIAVRSFSTGELITSLKGLRSPRSTGGLFGSMQHPFAVLTSPTPEANPTGDLQDVSLISFAPDQVGVLSLTRPELLPNQDPFQKANFLVETRQYGLARETLQSVTVHALNAEPIRQLQFRIAIGELVALGADAGPEHQSRIDAILALAKSPREQAIGHMLRLKTLADAKSPQLFDELAKILSGDESLLTVDVVPPDRLYDVLRNSPSDPLERSHAESAAESLRMPFRSWVIQQLRLVLNEADGPGREMLIGRLKEVSDEDVLQVHSPFLINEYLRRAEQHLQRSQFRESTMHLIVASISIPPDDRAAANALLPKAAELLARLRSLADNSEGRDPKQSMLIRRLVSVLHHELLTGKLPEEPQGPMDLSKAVRDRWLTFPDQTYTIQPVQTNGVQQYRQVNVRPIGHSASHDPFLSAFDWSIRRDPGSLLARSVANPDDPVWNLNMTATESTTMFAQEEVQRIGSVILLQNSVGVSAFSAIDHRWLWTRPLNGVNGRSFSILDRQAFTNFRARANFNSGMPIAGSSYRWICLQSQSTIEVLDLLNGRRLWTMTKSAEEPSEIMASEGFLSINSVGYPANGAAMILNPLDGSAGEVSDEDKDTEDDFRERFVLSTPDAFVVTESGTGRRRTKLQWIRPSTREVFRTLELSDMESGLFLDANTLVIVTDEQTFHVINLLDGVRNTLSYASKRDDAVDFDPTDMRIVSDGTNYYVFETSDDAPMRIFGMTYGLQIEPIGEELRVVSRVTGEVIWESEFEDDTMACIRGSLSPVMLLLRNKSEGGPNNRIPLPGLGNGNQQWSIGGISRMTGKSLLEFNASVRSINTHLHLEILDGGVLDLEAFGNRVRFRPQTIVAP